MLIKTGAWRRGLAACDSAGWKPPACSPVASPKLRSRAFGVSRQAASMWYRQWHHGGEPALRGAGRVGRRPRLQAAELDAVV